MADDIHPSDDFASPRSTYFSSTELRVVPMQDDVIDQRLEQSTEPYRNLLKTAFSGTDEQESS